MQISPSSRKSGNFSLGAADLFGGRRPAEGIDRTFYQTSEYIFGKRLPEYDYKSDNREHIEVMGDKYLGPFNPDSEEEVWIPIRKKMSENRPPAAQLKSHLPRASVKVLNEPALI